MKRCICIYTCTDLKRKFISVSSKVKGPLNLHKTSFVENKSLGHMCVYIYIHVPILKKEFVNVYFKTKKQGLLNRHKSSVCCSGCVFSVFVQVQCVLQWVCLLKVRVCCSGCVFVQVQSVLQWVCVCSSPVCVAVCVCSPACVAVGVCLFKSSVCRSGCVFVQVQCVLQWVCFFKCVST